MTLKTNYAGHDIAYEKKLSSGQDGWDHKSEYAQFAHRMSSVMQRVDTNGLVLELGCGAGNMSQWLKTIGYSDIVGVDISKAAIDHARLRLPDDQFYCLDLTQQPLNALSNSFDAVFDSHMLHCIVGDDRAAVFQEARRLLKPGGVFFGETMCTPVDQTIAKQVGYQTDTGLCVAPCGTVTRYIGSPENLLDELNDFGFDVIEQCVEVDESGIGSLRFACQAT